MATSHALLMFQFCENVRWPWTPCTECLNFAKSSSSETQGRLVGGRGNNSGKGLLVNLRRYISLPDLFPLAPTNRPWVSEDAKSCILSCLSKLYNKKNVRRAVFEI